MHGCTDVIYIDPVISVVENYRQRKFYRGALEAIMLRSCCFLGTNDCHFENSYRYLLSIKSSRITSDNFKEVPKIFLYILIQKIQIQSSRCCSWSFSGIFPGIPSVLLLIISGILKNFQEFLQNLHVNYFGYPLDDSYRISSADLF